MPTVKHATSTVLVRAIDKLNTSPLQVVVPLLIEKAPGLCCRILQHSSALPANCSNPNTSTSSSRDHPPNDDDDDNGQESDCPVNDSRRQATPGAGDCNLLRLSNYDNRLHSGHEDNHSFSSPYNNRNHDEGGSRLYPNTGNGPDLRSADGESGHTPKRHGRASKSHGNAAREELKAFDRNIRCQNLVAKFEDLLADVRSLIDGTAEAAIGISPCTGDPRIVDLGDLCTTIVRRYRRGLSQISLSYDYSRALQEPGIDKMEDFHLRQRYAQGDLESLRSAIRNGNKIQKLKRSAPDFPSLPVFCALTFWLHKTPPEDILDLLPTYLRRLSQGPLVEILKMKDGFFSESFKLYENQCKAVYNTYRSSHLSPPFMSDARFEHETQLNLAGFAASDRTLQEHSAKANNKISKGQKRNCPASPYSSDSTGDSGSPRNRRKLVHGDDRRILPTSPIDTPSSAGEPSACLSFRVEQVESVLESSTTDHSSPITNVQERALLHQCRSRSLSPFSEGVSTGSPAGNHLGDVHSNDRDAPTERDDTSFTETATLAGIESSAPIPFEDENESNLSRSTPAVESAPLSNGTQMPNKLVSSSEHNDVQANPNDGNAIPDSYAQFHAIDDTANDTLCINYQAYLGSYDDIRFNPMDDTADDAFSNNYQPYSVCFDYVNDIMTQGVSNNYQPTLGGYQEIQFNNMDDAEDNALFGGFQSHVTGGYNHLQYSSGTSHNRC